ncbi:MAG: hypothetical protein MJ000_11660 [Bacteroidales bacterium]|nr:hypothetical protein [Bacteroidales bacterium]
MPRTDWEMVPVYELESRENFEIGMVLSDGSRIRLTESISREVPWPILGLNLSGTISNVSIVSWLLNGEEYAAEDIEALSEKEKYRLSSAIRTLSQMVNASAEAMGDIERIPDGVQRYCYPALSEYGRKFYLETAVDMAIDGSNPGISTYTSPFEPDKQNEIYLNALEDINLQIPASYAFYNGVAPDSSKGLHKIILGAFPGTNQLYIGESKLEATT